MRKQGMTMQSIANAMNCTYSNIQQILQRECITVDKLQDFKSQRADLFADIQRKIILSMAQDDYKKVCPRDKAWIIGVLYDKERLERGQSTENVALCSIVEQINRNRISKSDIDNATGKRSG